MVDSTDFRTGRNENAASHSERKSRGYDMPNIRLLKKAANEASGEAKPEAYPLGYVEDFVEPRTKLGAFFSSLFRRFFDTDVNAPPTRRQNQEKHCRDCRCR